MHKISIILPVYNVEKYIYQCFKSIIQQTYKNIEIIIVDDCGKDNSMQIIKNYINELKSTDNIHIIKHEYNKGLSAARNTGIINATGDYIYFIDSDDFITEDCIETFIELIKKYPKAEIIFGSSTFFPNKWGEFNINVNNLQLPEYSNDKTWILSTFFQRGRLPITAWNKIIKREYVIKYNLLFKEGIIYEDELWYFLMGTICNKIAFNKKETYFYRNNSTGIMKKCGHKEMDSEIIIIKEFIKHLKIPSFFLQLTYTMHFVHTIYCKRFGCSSSPYLRYPKAFIFFIKSIFMKPEQLRNDIF